MEEYDERYQVRNDEIKRILRSLASLINDDYLPEGWGFTLFLFDFNTDKGSIFYMSSADRKDMIKALKEFIEKEENK